MPIVGMPDGTQVQFPDEMPADQIRGLIAQRFPKETAKLQMPEAPPAQGFTQKAMEVARTVEPYLPVASVAGKVMRGEPLPVPRLSEIIKGIWSGVTAPRDAYRGELPVLTDEGVSDEAIKRANQLAGAATLSTAPGGAFAAPRGSLGMGFARPGQVPLAGTVEAAAPGVMEAAERLGVSVPRYMVDPSRTTQGLAAGLQNIPVAGNKIAEAATETVRGIGEAARRAQEGYGTGSPLIAGEEAKTGLANWIAGEAEVNPFGKKAIADRAYGNVDRLVNPDITTELTATARTAQAILDQRANAKIPGRSEAVETILDGATTPGGLNYKGVKDLRSFLGEKTPQELAAQGLSKSEVKQLYGALSFDLRNATKNAGGDAALEAFDKANRLYEQLSTRADNLSKIIGVKGDAAPEAVFSRLLAMARSKSSADIGRLTAARKSMGADAWNEVASGIISRLGRDPQGDFSFQRFLTAYGNLSQEGRRTLFRSTGKDDLARSLEDINFLTKELEGKLKQFYNPSGTGKSIGAMETVLGIIHHPIRTLSTLVTGGKLANLLAEPVTARATADWLKAYRNSLISPSQSRAARIASENLAGIISRQTGQSQQAIVGQLLPTSITEH